MNLKFTKEEIGNLVDGGGLDIRIPGFACNPEAPDDGQIFIEYYQGKLHVRVWNGKGDPETITLEPFSGNYDYLFELFNGMKDNVDDIGQWKFVFKECKDDESSSIDTKACTIKLIHKSLKKEIIITPAELWADFWNDEKETVEQRNCIDVMLVCGGDDSQYNFDGWTKRDDFPALENDDRFVYEKFVKFVWTGEKDADLLNFIDCASNVIREVEDKYMDIITVGGPIDEIGEMKNEKDN